MARDSEPDARQSVVLGIVLLMILVIAVIGFIRPHDERASHPNAAQEQSNSPVGTVTKTGKPDVGGQRPKTIQLKAGTNAGTATDTSIAHPVPIAKSLPKQQPAPQRPGASAKLKPSTPENADMLSEQEMHQALEDRSKE